MPGSGMLLRSPPDSDHRRFLTTDSDFIRFYKRNNWQQRFRDCVISIFKKKSKSRENSRQSLFQIGTRLLSVKRLTKGNILPAIVRLFGRRKTCGPCCDVFYPPPLHPAGFLGCISAGAGGVLVCCSPVGTVRGVALLGFSVVQGSFGPPISAFPIFQYFQSLSIRTTHRFPISSPPKKRQCPLIGGLSGGWTPAAPGSVLEMGLGQLVVRDVDGRPQGPSP